MTRDTHPALITDAKAETFLTQRETRRTGNAVSRVKPAMNSRHLLASVFCMPEGTLWVGHASITG